MVPEILPTAPRLRADPSTEMLIKPTAYYEPRPWPPSVNKVNQGWLIIR